MHRLIVNLIGMAKSDATDVTQPSAGSMAEAGFETQRDAIKQLFQDDKDTDQFAGNISRTVVLNSYFYYRAVRTYVRTSFWCGAGTYPPVVRTYLGGYVPPL